MRTIEKFKNLVFGIAFDFNRLKSQETGNGCGSTRGFTSKIILQWFTQYMLKLWHSYLAEIQACANKVNQKPDFIYHPLYAAKPLALTE